jgi:hypothetical protein
VEVPEGVNREAVSDGRAGNVSANLGYIMNTPPRAFAKMMPGTVNVVTKSGTNVSKAKSRRATGGGGPGGGTGSGSAGGGGGGGFGKAPPPNAAPAQAAGGLFAVIDADMAEPEKLLSPAEKKRAALEARLHPSILAVVDRLKNKTTTAGADEAKFIRDGKAEVQVWLTEKSTESLAALKALGFEVVLDPKSAKLVIGRLPIERLEALAELKYIRYVAPQVSRD